MDDCTVSAGRCIPVHVGIDTHSVPNLQCTLVGSALVRSVSAGQVQVP
jgi:hypothetical protein